MNIYRLTDNLELIDLASDISGFENLIGVYVLHGNKTAIVDVGPSSCLESLFAGLRELGIRPADINYIFATHIHLDHSGGMGVAMRQMPHALAIVHEKGKPHLMAPDKLWENSLETLGETARMFGQPAPVSEDRIIVAREGMKIELGGMEIEVLLTPGHASHHLCFWKSDERRLFVGDAAGVYLRDMDLIRPDMPPPFNLEQEVSSLEKLINLTPETLCYTHFGCAANAVTNLQSIKKRILLWGNIIAEHIADEYDWQAIYEDIKKQDIRFKFIDVLPPDQRQAQLTPIKNTIDGYIGYFKKYGTGVLRDYNNEV